MMNLKSDQKQAGGYSPGFKLDQTNRDAAFKQFDAESGGGADPEDRDAPLDDAARSEREYVRQRLREELKREPTEQELDEWLRQHTEGY
ncbi:MAG TPA: hypothetical protein VF791_04130 [Pyrinomonadaceae bacterium]